MQPEEEREPHLPGFDTICAHWGEDRTLWQGAVIPPIYQNSLFTFPSTTARRQPTLDAVEPGVDPGPYIYTRVNNPTTSIAESKIAALEHADQARCFGSGMAAISAAILACVKSGDHVIAPDTVYGPTRQFLASYLTRFNVTASFVDSRSVESFREAVQPNTTLIYLESPSSMVMHQQDLAGVVALAREIGAASICDNSWASPYFQNPIDFGVDLVVHSATKYLGGHSDIVAGVVAGSKSRMERIAGDEGQLLGGILDPFASWLMIRGLRTLSIRMERHYKSASEIARRLHAHPLVERVFYPGVAGDPQAELTQKQLKGSSGLMSFALKANEEAPHRRVIDSLKYYGLGCSWGGFESLAIVGCVPAAAGGDPGNGRRWIIRIHIGLEDVEDLWCDLETAMQGA
jgi:cystathionine beta-lyase